MMIIVMVITVILLPEAYPGTLAWGFQGCNHKIVLHRALQTIKMQGDMLFGDLFL